MLAEAAAQLRAGFRTHTGRVLLTLAGIVWGTALVIVLLAWGGAMRDSLVEQAASGGRKMIVFFPGHSTSGIGANRGGHATRLMRDDAALVARALPSVAAATSGIIRWQGVFVRRDAELRAVVTLGLEPEGAAMMELVPATGRFFEAHDLTQRRRVAVLGHALAGRLFGATPPLGERVEVNGVGYEVVGVLARKGDQISSLGPPDDEKLFLPLTTVQALVTGDERVGFVAVAPRVVEEHLRVTAAVRRVLGTRHGFAADDLDALAVFDAMNFVDLFRKLTTALRFFVGALGVASLAIGGVGVTNLLLLAVNERRREIGLRRALGARRLDIGGQFLLEGLLLAVLGGAGGTALGLLFCRAAGEPGGVSVLGHVSLATIQLAVGLVGLVGVVAGLVPALRASGLDPAGALRAR